MKTILLKTTDSYGPLAIRLGLGIMMFPHGAQKMMAWFGGNGFSKTMDFFTQNLSIPVIFAFLAIIAEFFGAIGLITGFLTRISAFGVGITMLVAGYMHLGNGFFMNWYGNQKGEGFEFHLMAVAMAVSLIIQGSGKFGIDRYFLKRVES